MPDFIPSITTKPFNELTDLEVVQRVCSLKYTPQYFQRFYGFLRTHGELTIEQRKAAQQAIRTHGIIRLAERHLPVHPKVRRAIHDFMMLGKLSAMVIRDLDTLMKPYRT